MEKAEKTRAEGAASVQNAGETLAVENASGYLSSKCHRRGSVCFQSVLCQLLPIPKPSLPPPANCMEMDLRKYKAMHSMGLR